MAGTATLASCLILTAGTPHGWHETLRENAFDLVLAADHRVRSLAGHRIDARVIVVDIDRRSIEALGAWPWPRDTMAGLLDRLAEAKPAAIAVDILFSESDSRSPAALARRLGVLTARAEFLRLAESLPDGDKRLAESLSKAPVALGFVLDPDGTGTVPAVPIVTRGPLSLHRLWRTAGAVGPVAPLRDAAQGLGALSLPGDGDGVVRRVPLLVGAADTLLPGLSLEAVRLARRATAYLVQGDAPELRTGDLTLPLPGDGLLRLAPGTGEQRIARTLSAIDVIENSADTGQLAGAIAFIGGSAPELGGLRQTPSDPLTPSVQIQADAVAQIIGGRFPRPFDAVDVIESLSTAALGVLAIMAGAVLPPVAGVVATLTAMLVASTAAVGLSVVADRLLDPMIPSSITALVFTTTAVTAYAATRRRASLLRRSFEQHLAPAVVQRIVAEPGLMKLSGERREVTSLFTDIEGFTAMTHRAQPEQLVAALDDYFEEAATIIVAHGGMVDKIVGDAIHALFNAPIDLSDHPRHAVECAIALRDWSQAYRRRSKPAALGFGRTRIGIETGPAVVGDVGIRAKLDYTAHGDAINAAARLEAANKELGSAICVGPAATARCDPAMFRPLGRIVVRGRDDALSVFEPWPADAPSSWRQAYLEAFHAIDGNPSRAVALLMTLAAERPDDPVPRRIADRLRSRN